MKNIGYSYKGFTETRLKRFLQTGGTAFTFIGVELNKYNEPIETVDKSVTVLGVLHKSSMGPQILSSQMGSKTRSGTSTSILTSWESLVDGYAGGKELSPEMSIEIDGVEFKIIKAENLNNWNIVAEISLEEYDGWKH